MAEATILVLAAGQSARMRGADKLLMKVHGAPQLRRIAQAAAGTGNRVVITLAPNQTTRSAVLRDLRVEIICVQDAAEGMAASIRAGVQAIGPGCAIMILPADMPALAVADLKAVLLAHQTAPDLIWRGATLGQPGHPVIIPDTLVAELLSLRGDEGARGLIARHPERLRLLPLPGDNATLDLDTPEEWGEWLRRRQTGGKA